VNSPYNNIALPANSNNDVKRKKTAINSSMSHCLFFGCLNIQQIRICKEGDIGFCGSGKFFLRYFGSNFNLEIQYVGIR